LSSQVPNLNRTQTTNPEVAVFDGERIRKPRWYPLLGVKVQQSLFVIDSAHRPGAN